MVKVEDAPKPKVRKQKVQAHGANYVVTREVVKKKPFQADERYINPKGADHGQGAKMLLFNVVDDILGRSKPQLTDPFPPLIQSFEESAFLKKFSHPQVTDIPLLSQVATEKSIWPVHSNEKRKLIMDIQDRLKRNDGAMVRCRLSSEEMDDDMLHLLCISLPHNKYLQHLMLNNNAITDKGVEELTLALRWHPSIHTLWLGGNRITDLGVRHICHNLLKKNPNIRDLNLSNKWPRKTWSETEQKVHPHITSIGAEYIARQLGKRLNGSDGCNLTSLSLSDQRIRDAGANVLFPSLSRSKVRTLNLRLNQLSDGCAEALYSLLEVNPVMEQLNLSQNQFSDSGAVVISDSLAKNSFLVALDLSQNLIDDKGLTALADCLAINCSLMTLNTFGNLPRQDSEGTLALTARMEERQQSGKFESSGRGGSRLAWLPEEEGEEDDDDYKGDPYGGGEGIEEINPFGSIAGAGAESGVGISGRRLLSRPMRQANAVRYMERSFVSARTGTPALIRESDRPSGLRVSSPPAKDSPGRARSPSSSQALSVDVGISHLHDKNSFRDLFASPSSVESRGHSPLASSQSSTSSFLSSAHPSSSISSGINTLKQTEYTATAEDPSTKKSALLPQVISSPAKKPTQSNPNPVQTDRYHNIHHQQHTVALTLAYDFDRTKELSIDEGTGTATREGRKSSNLGKTIGVPHSASMSMGSLPIRSASSRHRDSGGGIGGHLMYLRVATPYDQPEDRPYSITKIANDREEEIKRLKEERQTARYKERKKDTMAMNPHFRSSHQKAADKPPPDYFWDMWKVKNHNRYPDGIDHAKGCKTGHFQKKQSKSRYDEVYIQQKLMVLQQQEMERAAAEAKEGGKTNKQARQEKSGNDAAGRQVEKVALLMRSRQHQKKVQQRQQEEKAADEERQLRMRSEAGLIIPLAGGGALGTLNGPLARLRLVPKEDFTSSATFTDSVRTGAVLTSISP